MVKQIPLTQGKFALVDDEDYERLAPFRWFADPRHKCWYARGRMDGRKPVYMHRIILGLAPGEQADHVNCDGLDNRRANLRKSSHGDNQHNQHLKKSNKSGFKGVHLRKDTGRYCARIRINYKIHQLGNFDDPAEAARAYDAAALRLRGEFAKPNSAIQAP